MNDEREIERLLRKFDAGPGVRVKNAVVSEFNRFFNKTHESRSPVGFWQRPIPMYAVLLCLGLALGAAFVAGRTTVPRGEIRQTTGEQTVQEPVPGTVFTSADDIEWIVTQRDAL
jgi:hypothetical protein